MGIIRCEKGHTYSTDRYSFCPYCAEETPEPKIPEKYRALGPLEKTSWGTLTREYCIRGRKNLQGKKYALKVIPCGTDTGKAGDAQYEANLLQYLTDQRCTGTVRLLDSDFSKNQGEIICCLLTDYHESLSGYLNRESVSIRGALQILLRLCEALISLREAGVLHLGIHPGSIRVDPEEQVFFGDFSSSLFIRDGSRVRPEHGNWDYMAPEAVLSHTFSEKSDIYSLGRLVYYLFRGKSLPRDNRGRLSADIEEAEQVAAERPEIYELPDVLLDPVSQLILKACAFRPEDRYGSVEELKQSLQDLLSLALETHTDREILTRAVHYHISDEAAEEAQDSVEAVEAEPEEGPWSGWNPEISPSASFKPKTIFCPKCGSPISGDSFFCTFCGSPLAAEQSAFAGSAEHSAFAGSAEHSAFTGQAKASNPRKAYAPYRPVSDGETMPSAPILRKPLAKAAKTSSTMPSYTSPAAPEKPAKRISKAEFSAIAPKKFIKGDYTMIDIFMYEGGFRHVVDSAIREADTEVQETRSGVQKVEEDSVIRITLSSPDIEIEDNEETRVWQGDYLDFSFAVYLPEDYAKRQVLFFARVTINDLPAVKLKFIAKVSSFFRQKIQVTREDVLTAFMSYASQDRKRVAAIIQGMQKIRPDLDVFFDVESLRSGEDWETALHREIENRDIFFLCWSHHARESEWVEKEWKYALSQKGIDCIEPVPIEPPGTCPPPEELKSKHFNDKLLFIIGSSEE